VGGFGGKIGPEDQEELMDSLSRRALLRGTLAAAGGLAAAKLLPSGSGLQKAVLGDQELRTNPNLEAFLAANINWRLVLLRS
jgi:hypothetical protein